MSGQLVLERLPAESWGEPSQSCSDQMYKTQPDQSNFVLVKKVAVKQRCMLCGKFSTPQTQMQLSSLTHPMPSTHSTAKTPSETSNTFAHRSPRSSSTLIDLTLIYSLMVKPSSLEREPPRVIPLQWLCMP